MAVVGGVTRVVIASRMVIGRLVKVSWTVWKRVRRRFKDDYTVYTCNILARTAADAVW